MKYNSMKHLAPWLAICALAACQDATQTPPQTEVAKAQIGKSAIPASAARVEQWDRSAAPVPGAQLTISPNPANFCEDNTQVLEVSWNMEAAKPTRLHLWLENPNGKKKLWAVVRDQVGSRRTGDWMRAGTRVVAVDPGKNQVLNEVTVNSTQCP